MLLPTVKLSSQNQVTLKKQVIDWLEIKSGQELMVYPEKGSRGERAIKLVPKPKSWAEYMSGLGKEIWENVNVDEYIRKERNSWEKNL